MRLFSLLQICPFPILWKSAKALATGTLLLFWAVHTLPGEWWDNFPRMVGSANSVEKVTQLNGNLAMNGHGQDPSWGLFFQASRIDVNQQKLDALAQSGIRQIGYFETFGESYCLIAELGSWNETDLTPVLHHYWNWKHYSGGTIRWLGTKDYFDDEEFARPFTRTHVRYGGPAMEYPDGTVATGYDGPSTDPRNSRVYDAGCSKTVLGELSITDYGLVEGVTGQGLLDIPGSDYGAGLVFFKKDSACPHWITYTYASALQAADAGIDGMWTDNYGPWDSLNSNPVQAGFGEWSVARFRDHLTAEFKSAELLSMGVSDVATFDIRDYLQATALTLGWDGQSLVSPVWKNPGWLDDPLWRAYLIHKRRTGTEALTAYYDAVKAAAAAAGKPEFLVAGNDIPGFSLGWCRGDLDMVSTELSLGWRLSNGSTGITPPPVGRLAPTTKLARVHARSRFVNFWLYTAGYEEALSHPELCRILYYEMLANHALPRFDSSNARIAGDLSTNAAFFAFVDSASGLFGNRNPIEPVGLYYSSSSVLKQLTPGGYANFNAQPHQFSFWGWGTALTELHIQYRAIPEWELTPTNLNELELLILPNADVLDPEAVSSTLVPWLNNGGKLVIAGGCGQYLGEDGNFALNPDGIAVDSILNHANVTVLSGNLGMDYYLAYEQRSEAQRAQFAAALSSHVPRVSSNASHTLGITLYANEQTGRFFIDLNNVNITSDTYEAIESGEVIIETRLPPWLVGKALQARVVSPDTPAVELLQASVADMVKLRIDSVTVYAGIIIEEAIHWIDPATGGNWDNPDNWSPRYPADGDRVLWRYAEGNPAIIIDASVAIQDLRAERSDPGILYWNTEGLKILNAGPATGNLIVDDGTGTIDLWDGGWFGAQLLVANEDPTAAASIIEAESIRVRLFNLDTEGTSGNSWFTHEDGTLEAQVQVKLGKLSAAGHHAEFRQTGGLVKTNHASYGLTLGAGEATATYNLNGGTLSISTLQFTNSDSTFIFNNGLFSPGFRDAVISASDRGSFLVAGLGVSEFHVEPGHSIAFQPTVSLSDKPGEAGSFLVTGGGTVKLHDAASLSGDIRLMDSILDLESAILHPDLYLLADGASRILLDSAATPTAQALSFDGGLTWQASGTWGAPGSGADHENTRFLGSGKLLVLSDQVPPRTWTESWFTAEEIAEGSAKANRDQDGDRLTNWQEYVAGTDPTDPRSTLSPAIRRDRLSSMWEISFNSVIDRQYSLYQSVDLAPETWDWLATKPGTGGKLLFLDPGMPGNAFYRVQVDLP